MQGANIASTPLSQTSQPQLWSPINPVAHQKNVTAPHPLFSADMLASSSLPSSQPLACSSHSVPPQSSQPVQSCSELPADSHLVSDCYASLLGLAETFRTMSPPNMRLAVHCLKAILHFKLPVNLEARTHLQLGRLLFHYSKSDEQTKFHLEKARTLGAHLKANDDSIKFEAAALLAEFFEKKGKRYEATCILNDAIRLSNNNPYWHCRILLELAQAHIAERDVNSACEILAMGSEYARLHNSDYTNGLFLLSKCMVSFIDYNFNVCVLLDILCLLFSQFAIYTVRDEKFHYCFLWESKLSRQTHSI
ncbi:unnamed protein product [Trichobilharzia regenti]|nr:unnamed protein product [Trichobilharzia regenti]